MLNSPVNLTMNTNPNKQNALIDKTSQKMEIHGFNSICELTPLHLVIKTVNCKSRHFITVYIEK